MSTMQKTIEFRVEDKFSKITLAVGLIALLLGGFFGLIQLIERTPYMPSIVPPKTYYTILTGHGVLLALVWTTFFIMSLAVYIVSRELRVNINKTLLLLACILAIAGTFSAALAILLGKAAVLYTFYPPLTAHPLFYLGLVVLIIGSWIFAVAIFHAYLAWRKNKPSTSIPLATMGVLTTLIIWLEATPPLAFMVLKNLVPMSLHYTPVDVLESRTYFWYFGHPLVYFWIVPAVTLWYYALPKILGVPLFSEKMAKIALILFIVASTPVGLHHQFVDPGISNIYKLVQTIFTFIVATPSLLTAFNIVATLERAGRLRGGNGVLGWLKKLPWGDPVFAGMTLAFILFGFGGISGVVNASFILNYVVHNTLWVVGHFHITVGTATTLTFIAASYLLIPVLFKREVASMRLARAQVYLWFVAIAIMSTAMHIVGLYGVPRRTYDVTYGGQIPSSWIPLLLAVAVGGIVLVASGALYQAIVWRTIFGGKRLEDHIDVVNEATLASPTILDNLRIWIIVAVILIAVAYIPTFLEIYSRGLSLVPPLTPEGQILG